MEKEEQRLYNEVCEILEKIVDFNGKYAVVSQFPELKELDEKARKTLKDLNEYSLQCL